MNRLCHFCGNRNFRDKNVQYIYRQNGKFLVVNDVPCVQCEYCGEQYFRAEVLKKIEKEFNEIYSLGKKSRKKISVPVEQYFELQPA
ncbi:MAG: type II toxin-antitoxin system MqsA family antitoxin [Desulfococcaceae bacterium]